MDGTPLKQPDLIKLNFSKNDDEQYVDPVTFKVLTDNTHIVAIRHGESANVFAYETVERLNVKAKMWRDLLSDEDFSRKDIITLQDPQNLESRDLSSFNYIKNEENTEVPKQAADINTAALGSSVRILKAKEAVAKARAERSATTQTDPSKPKAPSASNPINPRQTIPFNASTRTSGLAAASLTSTGFTPHTRADRALLSEEEYLLKPRRIKSKAHVSLTTTHGTLTLELDPLHAPKAVYNFLRLSQSKFYDKTVFHRNIRAFMIQGGDETGTGRGGKSIFGKPFEDEFDGPLKHDARGVLSMANKGKDSNSSQFFILYRAAKHLDRKHTVFGRVVEGLDVLDRLEEVEVDDKKRPVEDVGILEATVLSDPFAEFLAQEMDKEKREQDRAGGRDEGQEDERTTWTGKKIRRDGRVEDVGTVGVGKYLKMASTAGVDGGGGGGGGGAGADRGGMEDDDFDAVPEPARKKAKGGGGGFGDFDGW